MQDLDYEIQITNKHNQKLINILGNQKINGFLNQKFS